MVPPVLGQPEYLGYKGSRQPEEVKVALFGFCVDVSFLEKMISRSAAAAAAAAAERARQCTNFEEATMAEPHRTRSRTRAWKNDDVYDYGDDDYNVEGEDDDDDGGDAAAATRRKASVVAKAATRSRRKREHARSEEEREEDGGDAAGPADADAGADAKESEAVPREPEEEEPLQADEALLEDLDWLFAAAEESPETIAVLASGMEVLSLHDEKMFEIVRTSTSAYNYVWGELTAAHGFVRDLVGSKLTGRVQQLDVVRMMLEGISGALANAVASTTKRKSGVTVDNEVMLSFMLAQMTTRAMYFTTPNVAADLNANDPDQRMYPGVEWIDKIMHKAIYEALTICSKRSPHVGHGGVPHNSPSMTTRSLFEAANATLKLFTAHIPKACVINLTIDDVHLPGDMPGLKTTYQQLKRSRYGYTLHVVGTSLVRIVLAIFPEYLSDKRTIADIITDAITRSNALGEIDLSAAKFDADKAYVPLMRRLGADHSAGYTTTVKLAALNNTTTAFGQESVGKTWAFGADGLAVVMVARSDDGKVMQEAYRQVAKSGGRPVVLERRRCGAENEAARAVAGPTTFRYVAATTNQPQPNEYPTPYQLLDVGTLRDVVYENASQLADTPLTPMWHMLRHGSVTSTGMRDCVSRHGKRVHALVLIHGSNEAAMPPDLLGPVHIMDDVEVALADSTRTPPFVQNGVMWMTREQYSTHRGTMDALWKLSRAPEAVPAALKSLASADDGLLLATAMGMTVVEAASALEAMHRKRTAEAAAAIAAAVAYSRLTAPSSTSSSASTSTTTAAAAAAASWDARDPDTPRGKLAQLVVREFSEWRVLRVLQNNALIAVAGERCETATVAQLEEALKALDKKPIRAASKPAPAAAKKRGKGAGGAASTTTASQDTAASQGGGVGDSANRDEEEYRGQLLVQFKAARAELLEMTFAWDHALNCTMSRGKASLAMEMGNVYEPEARKRLQVFLDEAERGTHMDFTVVNSWGTFANKMFPFVATTTDGFVAGSVWAEQHENAEWESSDPAVMEESAALHARRYGAGPPPAYMLDMLEARDDDERRDWGGGASDEESSNSSSGDAGDATAAPSRPQLVLRRRVPIKAALEIKTLSAEEPLQRYEKWLKSTGAVLVAVSGVDGSLVQDEDKHRKLRSAHLDVPAYVLQSIHHAAVTGLRQTYMCVSRASTRRHVGAVLVSFKPEFQRAYLEAASTVFLWAVAARAHDKIALPASVPRAEYASHMALVGALRASVNDEGPFIGELQTFKPETVANKNVTKSLCDVMRRSMKLTAPPHHGMPKLMQLALELSDIMALNALQLWKAYELVERHGSVAELEKAYDGRLDTLLDTLSSQDTIKGFMTTVAQQHVQRIAAQRASRGEGASTAREAADAGVPMTIASALNQVRAAREFVGSAAATDVDAFTAAFSAAMELKGQNKAAAFELVPTLNTLRLLGRPPLQHTPVEVETPMGATYDCSTCATKKPGDGHERTPAKVRFICSVCRVPLGIEPRPHFGGQSEWICTTAWSVRGRSSRTGLPGSTRTPSSRGTPSRSSCRPRNWTRTRRARRAETPRRAPQGRRPPAAVARGWILVATRPPPGRDGVPRSRRRPRSRRHPFRAGVRSPRRRRGGRACEARDRLRWGEPPCGRCGARVFGVLIICTLKETGLSHRSGDICHDMHEFEHVAVGEWVWCEW